MGANKVDPNTRASVRGTVVVAVITLLGTVLTVAGAVYLGTKKTQATVQSESENLNGRILGLNEKIRGLEAIQDSSLVGVDAADVVVLSSDFMAIPEVAGPTVNVTGSLKRGLPGGVQIWVGTSIVPAGETPGVPDSTLGVDNNGPCSVDVKKLRFNCGEVILGNPGQAGSFAIYVGLADSSQSRDLVGLIRDQMAGKWEGAAPSNVKWLQPVVKVRQS